MMDDTSKTHRTIFNVTSIILALAIVGYIVAAFVMLVTGSQDKRIIACFMLVMALTPFGFFASWVVGERDKWRAYHAARAQPCSTLQFQPIEKEPGYNEAVLWWFHNGPELRERDDDFARAFNARAMVPPPKARRD